MSLCIAILVFGDIEVKIEHADEGIGHLPHLMHGTAHGETIEIGLLLVPIEVELGRKGNSSVQNTLGCVLGDLCASLTNLFDSCFKEPLDIDQSRNHQVCRRLLEALEVHSNEVGDLQIMLPLLSHVENYNSDG